jgi:glutamyl-tRNA(Gln) amidotransferase subunit E
MELDYARLGLKCGLEIHRQLDTHKLFCDCSSELTEDVTGQITRRLRPSKSEMGHTDEAAAQEGVLKREFTYQLTKSNCLVEMDEEPPHDMNPEALSIALTISRLMKAEPVDEVQVMRKIVIDGSNTTGFQRTALFALDGKLETPFGPVGIDTLCLEEDAARIIEQGHDKATYRLDRLCIPEIEVATSPDIRTPQQAMEAARAIGDVLRATGKVRRGLGTIRQDVNVSIIGGTRVELKLVQELQSIPEVVRLECLRQIRLIEVRDELAKRIKKADVVSSAKVQDLTQLLSGTGSKVLVSMLKKGGCILGVRLQGFAHTMGSRLEAMTKEMRAATSADDYNSKRILGPEFAQYAKIHGVKGIFHSDEFTKRSGARVTMRSCSLPNLVTSPSVP